MAGHTRTVAIDVDEERDAGARTFVWPWQLITVLGALGVAGAGWVLLGGLAAVVWLASSEAPLGEALRIATQFFALTHGAPIELSGQPITLLPLGLTLLLVFLALPVVGVAARRAAEHGGEPDGAGDVHVDLERTVWAVAGLHTGLYAATVVVVCAAVLGWDTASQTVLGALFVGALAGLRGAAAGVGFDPTLTWPGWLRVVPRAMGVAICALLAAGGIALAWAFTLERERVAAITESLEPGAVGGIALVAIHLAYLPNLVLWACSWLLGAGITVGDGSLVTLAISDVGLLPAIPALGAIPEPGVSSPYSLLWLAGGVVAGAMAGLAVTWARPRARFDETALVGGLSGVLAGLLITLLASLGSGGLGADRLDHVGARVGQLVVFAPTLLGIAGMLAGLLLGLLRRPPQPAADPPPAQEEPS